MNKKLALVAPAALLLAACGGGGGSDTGTLQLGVTDAPVDDVSEVWLTFEAVELLGGNGEVRQRFEIDPPEAVNLMELQGGDQRILVGTETEGVTLPAGEYRQVRFIVADQEKNCVAATGLPDYPNYVVLASNGEKRPLVAPSGSQTGLKVQGPLTIAAGGDAAYTVDFDLRRALAETGANECYNINPTSLRVVESDLTGTISGSVDSELLADQTGTQPCTANTETGEGGAVYVFPGFNALDVETPPEAVTTALLNEQIDPPAPDFDYAAGFVLQGEYTVAFTCNDVDFLQPQNVTVIAGQTADIDFAYIPPEPPPAE